MSTRHAPPNPTIRAVCLAGAAVLAFASATACVTAEAAHSARTTLAEAPDRFLDVPGARLRYRTIGPDAGEAVLLLHGYSDRIEMFTGLADSIARDFRVIVPDIRGFGQSTKFPSARDYGRKMVDDVDALLDSLRIGRVHVLGYSLGAAMGANLALREGGMPRVASLTLVAGPFYEDSVETATAFSEPFAALARGEGLTRFMQWILPDYPDSLIRSISAQTEAANDSLALVVSLRNFHELVPDWRAVARSKVPVVAVVSRRDPLLNNSRLIAGRWPGARLVEIADGDHAIITTLPEVLEEFRRVATGTRSRAIKD